MNKNRVEAFIDAIIAIVLTVLILEIKVPEQPSLTLFFNEWRIAFSYLMTFILVMFSWYIQHQMFVSVKQIKLGGFIGISLWLFVLSFLPITTSFVGRFPNYWGAELIYIVQNLLWLLTAQLMSYLIQRDNPNVAEINNFRKRQAGPFMVIANICWVLIAMVGIFFVPVIGMLTPVVTVLIQVVSNKIASYRLLHNGEH